MDFWNERFWFERSGAGYVFRPSVFSRGYEVSEIEKDRLFRGLIRLSRRLGGAALVWFAAIAAMVLTGLLDAATVLRWSAPLGIVGIGALTAMGMARRNRLIEQVLGGREADVPRLPFGTMISTPRPRVAPQVAAPLLRCVVVLLLLCLAVLDGVFGYLIYRAHGLASGAAEAGGGTGQSGLSADALSSPEFWGAIVFVNAALVFFAFLLTREARRLRKSPSP